jgi:hypothetical protein
MGEMRKRTLTIGLLGCLLAVAAPGHARAGEYHVYSCRTPAGEVAPVDGWVGSLAPGGAYDDYVENTCAAGGALVAALGDQTTHLADIDRSTWTFTLPTFASLVSANISRAGDTAGGGTGNAHYQFWLSAPKLSSVFDQCLASLGCVGEGDLSQAMSSENQLAVPVSRLGSQMLVSAGCGGATEPEAYECPAGQGDANNYAAAVYLYAADLTLEQAAGPTASDAGSELASATTVAGTSDLTFNATDPGSGVYEAVFTVDGSVVQRTVIDEDGGRCRDVGQTTDGLAAFLYLQPCPASVSADVGFETTRVSNGPHHLVVSVIDAAGNAAPVIDRMVTVDNPGAPGPANGHGASEDARLSVRWQSTPRARLLTAFGRREAIVGRLTGPGGSPISGAEIAVTATPAVAGGRAAAMRSVQTGADGAFVIRLPAGLSSRTLDVSYAAHLDGQPAASRALRLAVRAPVSLSIDPRTASVGGTIHFHGRLLAGPVPSGGKPLVLEARSGGGAWIEFDVIRASSRGRYRAGYRFKFPGPAIYKFRVVCEQEADYPFAAGASPTVTVYER